MASPTCEVKEFGGAYAPTTGGVNVTPSVDVFTIRLGSTADVDSWSIACLTTDELSVGANVNAGLVIDSVAKTATGTMPDAGRCFRFQSQVNGGIDRNGVRQASYTTTFCIYTLANGNRVHALDETVEGNSLTGWGADVNALIRASGGTAVVDLVLRASQAEGIVSADLDGNVDPTATLYTFPIGNDGIYWAEATVMVDEVIAGALTHAKGGMMRTCASWRVLAGVATRLRSVPASDTDVGGLYLLNPALDGADMDLDMVIVGGAMTVEVTPTVFFVARYQCGIAFHGPVTM
jgi:hypothetical protein